MKNSDDLLNEKIIILSMNVLIIGSGAVGIGLGTSLLSQKINVSFFASHETANEMKLHGIKRTGLFENYSFDYGEFEVYDNYSQIPDNSFDFILICTKTIFNMEFSEALFKNKRILNRDFKILTCQNGFGNDEFYLKYFNEDEVFCARIITGFKRPQRNISEITVYTEPIQIGSLLNADIKCFTPIADVITKSGIKCELTQEIDKYLWAKMIYNCTLNPLGAILDVNYGNLMDNPFSKHIMDELIEEIFDVLKKSPYSTFWENCEDYKQIFYSKLVMDTYDHYSSTHQDIKRKIKTEIDALNGKVIELAEQYDVEVNTNRTIYNLIKAIENNF